MKIIDRTADTASTHQTRNGRQIFSHGNARARRSVSRIDSVILHHTNFSSSDLARFNYVIANYIVMQNGHVLKVRDHDIALNSVGTNQRGIDIEFVGVYGTAAARPPRVQLQAGRDLVAYLKGRHGIGRVFGHAHFTPKSCPGPHIWFNVGLWAIRNGLRCDRATRSVPPAWSDPSLKLLPL